MPGLGCCCQVCPNPSQKDAGRGVEGVEGEGEGGGGRGKGRMSDGGDIPGGKREDWVVHLCVHCMYIPTTVYTCKCIYLRATYVNQRTFFILTYNIIL